MSKYKRYNKRKNQKKKPKKKSTHIKNINEEPYRA